MALATSAHTRCQAAIPIVGGNTPAAMQIYPDPIQMQNYSPRKHGLCHREEAGINDDEVGHYHRKLQRGGRMALRDLSNMIKSQPINSASSKLIPVFDKLTIIKKTGTLKIHSIENKAKDGDPNRNQMLCKIAERQHNHNHHTEYQTDIMQHLLELEILRRPSNTYMSKQKEITIQHRHQLVDWLSRLCQHLRYDSETLHLAINYMDRFLSRKNVPAYRMQLVGAASLFIAGKYEEVSPCTANDLLGFTGPGPNVAGTAPISNEIIPMGDLLSMESCMLNTLNFDLNVATANVFAGRLMDHVFDAYLPQDRSEKRLRPLVMYLTELSLLDYGMLAYKPSQIAMAALAIALHILGHDQFWSPELSKSSGCNSVGEIRHCTRSLFTLLECSPTLGQSIRRKYLRSANYSVAALRLPLQPPTILSDKDHNDDCNTADPK